MKAVTRPSTVAPASTARPWTTDRVRRAVGQALIYIILVVGAFVVCFPWIWMILTSLKTPGDILRIPLTVFPHQWMWRNYLDVLVQGTRPMWVYVKNSLIIVVLVESGILVSNTVVAFGFSRLHWKFRDAVFVAVLATMMLPSQVTMIPVFAMFTAKLHWTNTYLPLVVPAFFGAPWAIFLLRQYMMTIPSELDDAARIDGCSTFGLFARVIVPMSAPVLAVVAIFTFNSVWNDFFGPLLYLSKPKLFTVAQWLAGVGAPGAPGAPIRYDLLMAASLLTSVPMALLFFVFQRQFIQGIVITGVKG